MKSIFLKVYFMVVLFLKKVDWVFFFLFFFPHKAFFVLLYWVCYSDGGAGVLETRQDIVIMRSFNVNPTE